jgi:NAD(P)-dependent dehydrogenase (short-subunit alcohol dehydrogenase family)
MESPLERSQLVTRLSPSSEFEFGVDLKGKNIVVTGASSGIGAEAARVFATAGARVFALGRDVAKTMAVVDAISAACGEARVSFVACDLSNLASVRAAAADINALRIPIHVLLNNAGVMAIPVRTLTTGGFEMQIGTSHVGHFVLTDALAGALKAGAPSRVVSVPSLAHRRGGIVFDDMMLETEYEGWRSYGQSKSANILYATELNRRWGADGVLAVSLHPGVITDGSDLWRHSDVKFAANKNVAQGAPTSIYCCVAPGVAGGAFYVDCAEAPAAPHATDPALAQRLWATAVALLGEN